MRVLLVAHNELAIVTKSIAFALSPATRSPWVPFQGGTARGKTPEERGKLQFRFATLTFERKNKNVRTSEIVFVLFIF